MTYTNQDAYDIGVRLAQNNPGIAYEDLAIDEAHNREATDLVVYIDDEEADGLAVYLEDGFMDQRAGKVRKIVH